MSDTVLAALISAAAALIVGSSGAYFALRQQMETAQRRKEEAQRREEEAQRKAKEAQRSEAAAYLMVIADTILGMRKQLREEQIPHTLGHRFIGLLNSYEDRLQPILGDATRHELDKLKRRVQEPAEIMDGYLYSGRGPEPEELSKVLADMERVAGDVQAQITLISATQSRADE